MASLHTRIAHERNANSLKESRSINLTTGTRRGFALGQRSKGEGVWGILDTEGIPQLPGDLTEANVSGW